MTVNTASWVFGYGSLIWRPDFPFIEAQTASISGFCRRFWQGSHDHRGIPEAPGRVVTLVPDNQAVCVGKAFYIDSDVVSRVFEQLDYREKNGYQRVEVTMQLADERVVDGLVYIAVADNFAYLGDAPENEIAQQIANSHGPSGANADYLFELAAALRQLDVNDDHVFSLEARVRAVLELS